jgi:hypothetical protein
MHPSIPDLIFKKFYQIIKILEKNIPLIEKCKTEQRIMNLFMLQAFKIS